MESKPRTPVRLLPVILLAIVWTIFLAMGLRHVLIPPVAALVLVFLLFPYHHEKWAQRTIAVSVGLALVWLLGKVSSILWIAGLGLSMAYLLNPPVAWLERKGVPRSRGVVLVVFPAVLLFGVTLFFALPPLFAQASELVAEIPGFVTTLYDRSIGSVRNVPLESLPIDLPAIVERLTAAAESLITGAGQSLVGVARRAGGFLSILLLSPIVGYRLLKDLPALRRGALHILPRRMESEVEALFSEMDVLVGRYLRGQMLVSLIVGGLTIAGLTAIGLPYAIVIGALAGALNMVPIIGYWISLILALLVTLSTASPGQAALAVGGVFFVIQILEQNFISPKILGDQTGLHPVAVLLSLLVFTSLGGLAGALLAIPFTLFLRLFFRRYVAGGIREADFS